MDMNRLTPETIAAYALYLRSEEHAPGTIEKYLRDVRSFAAWLEERTVTNCLEGASGFHQPCSRHGQFHAGRNQQPVSLPGPGLPGKVPEGAAQDVPGFHPGTDPA